MLLPGCEESVRIRLDHWLPNNHHFHPVWREDVADSDHFKMVSDLTIFNVGQWDVGLIRRLFTKELAEEILRLQVSRPDNQNC